MSSLDTEFNRRLGKKLEEADATVTQHLRSGALDYDSYKEKCGYGKALEHVREWCNEIEENITKGK